MGKSIFNGRVQIKYSYGCYGMTRGGGSVEPDKFLTIATMVVAFYFGTQNEKKS